MRNGWIDIARFVFAFLVVLIHVPMRGAVYLHPLARCAVPFFFITAEYFCCCSDNLCYGTMLQKNIRKWYALWGKYIISFCFIALLMNCFISGEIIFSDFLCYSCNI